MHKVLYYFVQSMFMHKSHAQAQVKIYVGKWHEIHTCTCIHSSTSLTESHCTHPHTVALHTPSQSHTAHTLTEIWLQWVRDELPLCSLPEAALQLRLLFETAVDDYLCEWSGEVSGRIATLFVLHLLTPF